MDKVPSKTPFWMRGTSVNLDTQDQTEGRML